MEKTHRLNALQAASFQKLAFTLINNVLVSININDTSYDCEDHGPMRHDCFRQVADFLGKPEMCDLSKSSDPVDCKERATVTLARDTLNVNLCKGITDDDNREDCFAKVAMTTLDVKVCNMMTEESGLCIVAVAAKAKNPKLCSALPDERSKKQCITMVEYDIRESERPQPADMLIEIKKQVTLPNEDPSFMEISDIEAWRESGDATVKKSLHGAQNGDYVLFFEEADKVLIYSVLNKKVLYFDSY